MRKKEKLEFLSGQTFLPGHIGLTANHEKCEITIGWSPDILEDPPSANFGFLGGLVPEI